MLTRIVRHSISRRRRSKLLSFTAVALGIAVATTVATIALDVGDRVNRELRSFGANISVTPIADTLPVVVGGVDYRPAGAGAFLQGSDLARIKKIFWHNNIVGFAPFLYVPAQLDVSSPPDAALALVLVGSWFDHTLALGKAETFETGLKKLHPEWKIDGSWPRDDNPSECLVGRRLAERLGLRPHGRLQVSLARSAASAPHVYSPAEVQLPGKMAFASFTVSGILDSGGAEDDQVLAPLESVQKLAGLEGKVRRVEVSALTKPEDAFARRDPKAMTPAEFERWSCSPYVRSIAYQIQEAIPGAEAKPVLQVASTEGRIVDRVGFLMWILVAAGLTTAALAVTSMMLATVLERRVEIALFKALGATDARVANVFMLEAFIIGLLGGTTGYFLGSLMARRLSVSVFGAPASFHWVILPTALLLALTVALVGSALPLARALKLSPAAVLRD
jgi:putative ABC transport system permease protein